MVHWLEHLYGPSNHFNKCPQCKREFTDDEMRIRPNLCDDCAKKGDKIDEVKSVDNRAEQ